MWDLKTTGHFIQACLDQVYKGQCNGTTLTKKVWKVTIAQFGSLSGKNYDKTQFKNKWDSLKKECSMWYKLVGKEIGLGQNIIRNIVDALEEWWEKK